MSMRGNLMLCVVGLMAVLLMAGGCKHQKPVVTDLKDGGTTETTKGGGELPNVDQEKLNWTPYKELQKVYFDYDSFALRPDALKALAENADIVKKDTGVMVQVEGHCDERGTQEYNMALGEKRALAVREHLIKLGVSGDRIVTISYGKERPVALGHDESAWKQNRRCEFNKAAMPAK